MIRLSVAGALALTLMAGIARAEPTDPMISQFAQDAAVSNAFETAQATIILEDSTNPAARAFAREMLSDHEAAQRDLDQAGRISGATTRFILDAGRQGKVDDLGLMDGAKLDQAYLADQVAAHAGAAATLEGYAQTGTDPALVAYARRTLPVVLHHQRMLEQMTGQPAPM